MRRVLSTLKKSLADEAEYVRVVGASLRRVEAAFEALEPLAIPGFDVDFAVSVLLAP